MNKKRIVLICVIIIIAVITAILYMFITNKNRNIRNISDEVLIDGIKISDAKLEYNNLTTYQASVENIKHKAEIKYIEITIYYDNDEYILKGYIGKKMKVGEKIKITSSIDVNLSNASKVSYKIIK